MRAKKSLGQNFLKSSLAVKKIIEAGEINAEDTVLEIGPGKGILTEKLLEVAKKVIAVEKDGELFEVLKIKFEKEIKLGSLLLIHGDILEFDMNKVARQDLATYKIIANIPYNITGAILKKFLTANPPAGGQPERMVLMVQQEVAERIMGRGKESILSISVKAYGKPKMIMKVEARYFSPAPKVNSAVILISEISRDFFIKNGISEEKFWEIVKKGFAHKRKRLLGNLKGVLPARKTESMPFGNKRAEDLSLSDWIMLVNI